MSEAPNRFSNRTIAITGGYGGIGHATALRLAREGAQVVIAGRNRERIDATVEAIRSEGGIVSGVVTDVTSPQDNQRFAAEAAELGGGTIDGLFNNAGIGLPSSDVEHVEVEDFDRVMAVNVRGVFLGMQAVLPFMKAGGSIVNNGSAASLRGFAGDSAYTASKHAVLGLTRAVAQQVASRGIRVNILCPGPIDTPMLDASAQSEGLADGAAFAPLIPLGRIGSPPDIAAAVSFLLSEESSFITGSEFRVDGGAL